MFEESIINELEIGVNALPGRSPGPGSCQHLRGLKTWYLISYLVLALDFDWIMKFAVNSSTATYTSACFCTLDTRYTLRAYMN